MIAEVILTPDVFKGTDDVVRQNLRDLREYLLPRRGVPPAVVCALGSHTWMTAVTKAIATISNSSLQQDARQLLLQLKSKCWVERTLSQATPLSQIDWLKESIASSRTQPLDAIVVDDNIDRQSKECIAMEQFLADEFWGAHENPRMVARNEAAQSLALRTICRYASKFIVRFPYVFPGEGNELFTIKQIIKLVGQNVDARKNCTLDVHLKNTTSTSDKAFLRQIERELEMHCRDLHSLSIHLFPDFALVNRELLAFDLHPLGNGKFEESAKWLVTMQHVAINVTEQGVGQFGNTWSLYDAARAGDRATELRLLVDRLRPLCKKVF